MKVLVLNHAHTIVCGIHDIGLRLTARLNEQADVQAIHVECFNVKTALDAVEEHEPDAVIVNFREDITPWAVNLGDVVIGPPVFGIVHNYEPATADAHTHHILAAGFDFALFLDHDLIFPNGHALTIGRPMPASAPNGGRRSDELPRIGTFGFAFPHKGFHLVVREADERLDSSIVNVHVPEAYFNGARGDDLYAPEIIAMCNVAATRPETRVSFSRRHLPPRLLVQKLAGNDVNCLFYNPGQPDPGLSSALDYLIAAGRPILISDCLMFRHSRFAPRWPTTRIDEVLANWEQHRTEVATMHAWHVARFAAGVEELRSRL